MSRGTYPPNDVKNNAGSNVDLVVIDGTAFANVLKPVTTSQTFHNFINGLNTTAVLSDCPSC